MDLSETIEFFRGVLIGNAYFLLTSYIYLKISVLPVNNWYKNRLLLAVTCTCFSVVFVVVAWSNILIANLFSLIIPSIFYVVFEKDKRLTRITICFLSSCFVRIASFIPSVLVGSVLYLIKAPEPFNLAVVLVYLLTALLVYLFLKIKRFKRGFQFIQNKDNLGIGVLISGIVFVISGFIFSNESVNDLFTIIVVIGLAISGFGLYLWIRRSITAHYRERLQLKTEEHYQQLLAESEEKNRQLSKSNEFLAKVVHRDNHIISSLNQSVDAYFQNGDKNFRDDLLREIQTLAKERGELIEAEQRNLKILPSTGSLLIDGAIRDLYIKAAATSIDFDLNVSAPLTEIIGKYISQTDLQTLLCDHIKDAVIAVNANGSICGKILITLSMNNGNYEISIFDNGVEFKTDTLAKLGEERVTTHADSGGSGIGFMTTFETLRKSYASMIITEFENKTPFSKSVTFRFDSATSFIVISYRAEELQRAINRSDVMILPKVI